MKERKTIYLKPPVSASEKAKLLAEGYKIMDARFAPAGAVIGKPKAVEPEPEPVVEVEEPAADVVATDAPEIVVEAETPRRTYRRRKKRT